MTAGIQDRVGGTVLAACVLALLVAGHASSAPTTTAECQAAKIDAVAKKARNAIRCYAKATQATASLDNGCIAKAERVFSRDFARAESTGLCTTSGDVAVMGDRADAFIEAVSGELPRNPGTERCTSRKYTAVRSLSFSVLRAYSKNESSPDPEKRDRRLLKAESRAVRLFGKADTPATCPGASSELALVVHEFTGDVLRLLCESCATRTSAVHEGAIGFEHPPALSVSRGTSSAMLIDPSKAPVRDEHELEIPTLRIQLIPNPDALPAGEFAAARSSGKYLRYSERTDLSLEGHPAVLLSDLPAKVPLRPRLVLFVELPDGILFLSGNTATEDQFFSLASSLTLP